MTTRNEHCVDFVGEAYFAILWKSYFIPFLVYDIFLLLLLFILWLYWRQVKRVVIVFLLFLLFRITSGPLLLIYCTRLQLLLLCNNLRRWLRLLSWREYTLLAFLFLLILHLKNIEKLRVSRIIYCQHPIILIYAFCVQESSHLLGVHPLSIALLNKLFFPAFKKLRRLILLSVGSVLNRPLARQLVLNFRLLFFQYRYWHYLLR